MRQLLDIIFEDESIVVVNKPGGLSTQAPKGCDSLETRLREYLRWKSRKADEVYVGIPHRLDRAVSGAIVFACRRKFARRLSKQFERREIEKTYWALVEGAVDSRQGTLVDSMRKVTDRPFAELHPDGKQAVLHYRILHAFPRATAVEIQLETGRMHQIRLQWASRGHAVLGDAIYGSSQAFGPKLDVEREQPIALHAKSLRFCHPATREMVEFHAPLPDSWEPFRSDLAAHSDRLPRYGTPGSST